MRTLGWRPCPTTLATTLAPATSGAPTTRSAPLPIATIWSSLTSWPTSAASRSTLIVSPAATRYCLPPVLMTAYIVIPSLGCACHAAAEDSPRPAPLPLALAGGRKACNYTTEARGRASSPALSARRGRRDAHAAVPIGPPFYNRP